nr:hypothetical protein [Tanacetum cinerariifolium]
MDLFAFIRHADPTKVRIGERDLSEHEVKLLKMTEGHIVSLDPFAAPEDSGDNIDRLFDDANQEHSVERGDDVLEETIAKDASEVVAEKTKKKHKRMVAGDTSDFTHPPKKLRDDYQSLLPNTSGKSLVALCGMVPEGSGIRAVLRSLSLLLPWLLCQMLGPWIPCSYSEATSFVRSFVADAPVVTKAVTTIVVVDITAFLGSKARGTSKDLENIGDSASAGGANADAASISKLNKHSSLSDSFYAFQSLDTETMHCIYVPKWKVTNDSILEDPYVCRNFMDRLAMPALFAQLRIMDYDQPYSEFNVGVARQVCLGAEVRMRERDVMSEKIATLEFTNVAKEDELTSISSQVAKLTSYLSDLQLSRDELNSQMASLESERDGLISKRSSLQSAFELFSARIEATLDEQAKVLGTAIGCAINKGIQDGLRAEVDHGKAERDLSIVEAYDPFAEAKYVEAVNAFGIVDFSLHSELKSKKDTSIVDLMDSLRLEGPLAEILERKIFNPSLTNSGSQSIGPKTIKASTFAALVTTEPVTTLSTTFASSDVVPLLLTSDDQASGVEPHDEEPHIVSFEKEDLVTSLE